MDDGVLTLEVVPINEVLVLEEFFLLLLPEINRSPLPLSSPLLRLFLFSLLLPSNLDINFSSLPRNFSDEPGDLEATRMNIKFLASLKINLLRFSELSAALMSSESRFTEFPSGFPSKDFSTS